MACQSKVYLQTLGLRSDRAEPPVWSMLNLFIKQTEERVTDKTMLATKQFMQFQRIKHAFFPKIFPYLI